VENHRGCGSRVPSSPSSSTFLPPAAAPLAALSPRTTMSLYSHCTCAKQYVMRTLQYRSPLIIAFPIHWCRCIPPDGCSNNPAHETLRGAGEGACRGSDVQLPAPSPATSRHGGGRPACVAAPAHHPRRGSGRRLALGPRCGGARGRRRRRLFQPARHAPSTPRLCPCLCFIYSCYLRTLAKRYTSLSLELRTSGLFYASEIPHTVLFRHERAAWVLQRRGREPCDGGGRGGRAGPACRDAGCPPALWGPFWGTGGPPSTTSARSRGRPVAGTVLVSCTTERLCHCTTVLLCHCTTVLLCYSTAAILLVWYVPLLY